MAEELKMTVSGDEELVLKIETEGDEPKQFELTLRKENFKINIGEYEFDFFPAADDRLGFTVARKGDLENDDAPFVDIFVTKELKVSHL